MKMTIRHYSGAEWNATYNGEKVVVHLEDGQVEYTAKEVMTYLFTGTWEIVNK